MESLQRRTLPAAAGPGKIKSLGVKFFSALVKGMDLSHAEGLEEPLWNLAAMLSGLEPAALFTEWSPPREPFMDTVAVDTESCTASNTWKAAHAADKALSGSGYWRTDDGFINSSWRVNLAKPGQVHAVEVAIPNSSSVKALPEEFSVGVSTDGSNWEVVATVDKPAASQVVKLKAPSLVPSTQIRILFKGHGEGNTAHFHALQSFRAMRVSAPGSHETTLKSLTDLHAWLGAVVAATPSDDLRTTALRALSAVTQASASLGHLVAFVEALLACPSAPLPSAVAAPAGEFVAALQEAARVERAVQSKAELRSGAGGSAGGGYGEIDARFVLDDDSGSASRVELRDDGKVAHSNSGSHSVVFLDQGPFTAGKAAWEILLVQDTNSQCTCFGLATKPVSNCNYERSAQLWMYRAYNGYRYSMGSCNSGSTYTKIFKGDTVRLELNMDAGTCNLFINGIDQGVVFTDLAGKEIWPCIQFYSSGRTVQLVKFEGPKAGGGSAAAAVEEPLGSLTPRDVRVGYGSLGVAGDLGYNEGSARTVKFQGDSDAFALSMHPPVHTDEDNDDASATFVLDQKYERFSCSVALNDDVPAEAFADQGSPVRFEVLGDGKSLWVSDPVTEPKAAQECSVSVLEVTHLRLRVWVESANRYAHAVWLKPKLTVCEDWSCDGWRNEKSTFTCALTGTRRGEVTPLPDVPADASTSHGLAVAVLTYAGLLANEYLRGMRAPASATDDGVSSVDLESPYSVQVARDVLNRLAYLLRQGSQGQLAPELLPSLLFLVRANVRRLTMSRVDFATLDLGATTAMPAGATESKSEEDAGASEDVPTHLHTSLKAVAQSNSLPDDLRALALEVETSALHLFVPDKGDRIHRFNELVPGGGVLEVQLSFPCDAFSEEGDAIALEALLLNLQLECRKNGWQFALLGRWPAKVYLVMDVPEDPGVTGFVSHTLANLMERVHADAWSFPDGLSMPELPLVVETTPKWNRRARLPYESGVGAVRAYSSSTSTFEQVVESVKAFLPPAP